LIPNNLRTLQIPEFVVTAIKLGQFILAVSIYAATASWLYRGLGGGRSPMT
jgi:hypothetical protein